MASGHSPATDSGGPASPTPSQPPLLRVENLSVAYRTRQGAFPAVRGLSFSLAAGQSLGLVGESGCGKTTVAFAVMHHLGRAGRITGGGVSFAGRRLDALGAEQLRTLRGNELAMVYQQPLSCLNPVMPVGAQLMEVPRAHEGVSAAEARRRALAALAEVRLPQPEQMLGRYPHQLSGGQQQRVLIAMALICRPALLVLDEPTTGLDATIEAEVLEMVADLRARHGMALLFISHDLAAVSRVCERVAVMYAGELVEEGSLREVFTHPAHPYTRGLLDCLPTLAAGAAGRRLVPIPGRMPEPHELRTGCGFAPRCGHAQEICHGAPVPVAPVGGAAGGAEKAGGAGHFARCVRQAELPGWPRADPPPGPQREQGVPLPALLDVREVTAGYRSGGPWSRGRKFRALGPVTLQVAPGRTLAIVGESGGGKSTLAKVITGLAPADGGTIHFQGYEIATTPVQRRPADLRRALQMVFQNPESTLNPCHTVGFALSRALRRLTGLRGAAARAAVAGLLRGVHLPEEVAGRFPRQLSGGQVQRVAIGRALAGAPALIVADEPVSALDVSVQAAIVNLMLDIQAQRGTALVFISHDLPLVSHLADQVAVVYLGQVMEWGSRAAVFRPPHHPYTEVLLSAATPQGGRKRLVLESTPPPASAPATLRGCPFHPRCPRKLGAECEQVAPPRRVGENGHLVACHIPLAELAAKTGG